MIQGLPASGDLIDLGAVSPRVAPGKQIATNQSISTAIPLKVESNECDKLLE